VAVVNVESLLAPLAPDAPCGENLEYDAEFTAFERALQGKPEVQYGATLVAAEPPDWKAARTQALALFSRTRDLRIAVPLAQTLLHTDGLDGFADGLRVVAGLLQSAWSTVHPQLDPQDGDDPTMRVNSLAALCDANGTLKAVRETCLVTSRVHGRFSLRDLDLAGGEAVEGVTRPELATIDAAFMDAELSQLQAVVAALAVSIEQSTLIENTLQAHVGAAQALDLAPLRSLLSRARAAVDERIGRRADAPQAMEADVAAGQAAAPAGVRSAALAGDIGSRDDVIRMLDRICEYYRQAEPSSPVPLMLKRARRLVPMGFHEIIADLAPDGLGQVEKILGVSGSDSAS
jgi:type VI secretion system protein ImpA